MNRFQITDVIDACEKIETVCSENYQCIACPVGSTECNGKLLEIVQMVLNNFYENRVNHD